MPKNMDMKLIIDNIIRKLKGEDSIYLETVECVEEMLEREVNISIFDIVIIKNC